MIIEFRYKTWDMIQKAECLRFPLLPKQLLRVNNTLPLDHTLLLVLCGSFPPRLDFLSFAILLFDTFGLIFSLSSESSSTPSFSFPSLKSNNSILSSSSLSNTGITCRFWLVDFAFLGFGGLGALRGVLRGMGLGSSSLSSFVFFCRFFFVAGVRPFWARVVLPKE